MSNFGLPAFTTKDFASEAGAGFAKIIWKDGLSGALKGGAKKTREAAWVTAQYMAPRVEAYMKTSAPWTDQTGNARNGLAARAYMEAEEIGIVLYHQVPYGIYLETRFDGQYSVISPTMEVMGPQVMQMFDRMLERM